MHRHEFTSPEEERQRDYVRVRVCARVRECATLFSTTSSSLSRNAADRNLFSRRYTYGVSLTNRRLPFNDRLLCHRLRKTPPRAISRESAF